MICNAALKLDIDQEWRYKCYYRKSESEMQIEKYDDALSSLSKCRFNVNVLMREATCQHKLKRYDESIRSYDKAITIISEQVQKASAFYCR